MSEKEYVGDTRVRETSVRTRSWNGVLWLLVAILAFQATVLFLFLSQLNVMNSHLQSILYRVNTSVSAPNAAIVDTSPAHSPSVGPRNAAVMVIEFSDFECPYCAQASQTMNRLIEEYAGRVRFVFRNFPLPGHPHAFDDAVAALCANKQGRFWELHDILYARQHNLTLTDLKQYAGEIGLNQQVFDACLNDPSVAAEVEQDISDGKRYSVGGVPTFFVNDHALFGVTSLEEFRAVIEAELAAAGK